jgi:hypothetical protein
LLNSLVLGLVAGGKPSPQDRGLSGDSGELWNVPLLTGEGPGGDCAAAAATLKPSAAAARRHNRTVEY